MLRLLSIAIGILLVGTQEHAAGAADKDAEALMGKWQAIEGTRDGKALTREDLAQFNMILGTKGGRLGWQDPFQGGSAAWRSLHIDATKSPMQMYLLRQIGLKATTYPAIVRREKDRLIVCWNLEPWTSPDGPAMRPVPKEFAAPKGSGFTLLIYERVKE